jgi:hypothetical protein
LTYRKRWYGARSLLLRTRSLYTVENLPNSTGNELNLGIARADEELARTLVRNLELVRSEQQLQRMDELPRP